MANIKHTSRIGAWLLILMMLISLSACNKEPSGENTAVKEITVTIVYADKTTEELSIETEAQYLADALVEEGVITYSEDGYYTTVGGVTADYSVDQGWWCLTKDGTMTTEGFNTQPIADGDKFEITYTIG